MDLQLLTALSQHDLILTVNQRLSLSLKRQYDLHSSLQQRSWAQANVMPLTSWLSTLWEQHASTGYLLSPWQEQQRWQTLVQGDDTIITLNPEKTAALAQQANTLMDQWGIPADTSELCNADITRFLHWRELFRAELSEHNWVTQGTLTAAVIDLLASRPLPLPPRIGLLGFDELTPMTTTLIAELEQHVIVNRVRTTSPPASYQHCVAEDSRDEIEQMAHWARSAVEQGKHVGIVLPNLNQLRDRIEHHFAAITPKQYNLSAGKPLLHYEMLQVAVQALSLGRHASPGHTLYHWMQSPYINHTETDIASAAQLDRQLRETRSQRISLATLVDTATQCIPTSTWPTRLQAFHTQLNHVDQHLPADQWAHQFGELLHAIGWPGGRALDSLEHQLFQQMQCALTALSTLTAVCEPLNFSSALTLLRTYLHDTAFQAEGSSAPIQILGTLESAGLNFDALWFGGLTSNSWPPAAKANPFIPLSLQKQYQIPHSSAERELHFCQLITDRLTQAAAEIIFSWPQRQDDQTLHPSPLIPPAALAQPLPSPPIASLSSSHAAIATEWLSDFHAPPVDLDERIRGGSAILQHQANCPFKAFSTIRLNATPLAEPEHGLNAATRGILVHRVLETLWAELGDQQHLLALNQHALNQCIDSHIAQALAEQAPTLSIQPFFLTLEHTRLTRLVQAWLALEKERPPFTVVSQESEHRIHIGQLHIRVKIDRIDRTMQGSRLLIDYKTGDTTLHGWFGERLEQPQLPLYCAFTQQEATHAISFAEVRTNRSRFNGIASTSHTDLPTDITALGQTKATDATDWATLLERWRAAMESVSHEFTQGLATVTPHSAAACRHCHLQSFCRIAS